MTFAASIRHTGKGGCQKPRNVIRNTRVRMIRPLATVAAAGVLLGTACAAKSTAPLEGHWVIREWSCPQICAMDSAQAKEWVGKAGEYTLSRAEFAGERCEQPEYHEQRLSAADYASGFNASPQDLGITTDSVLEIDVYCDGQKWTAPGGSVAIAGTLHVTWWDGIMFTLQRP